MTFVSFETDRQSRRSSDARSEIRSQNHFKTLMSEAAALLSARERSHTISLQKSVHDRNSISTQ
jgi:hypothetical protein